MIRKTFYLIDIENDNGILRWSWTGFNDWNLIDDLDRFLEIYFPPPWWGRVRTELGLSIPKTAHTIVFFSKSLPAVIECPHCGNIIALEVKSEN